MSSGGENIATYEGRRHHSGMQLYRAASGCLMKLTDKPISGG